MGIAIVFCAGLAKLWLMNRHMRKLEGLDAEKQARAAQMQKSGLAANPSRRSRPGAEIPFGVKALEGGVEVEGIWVARMASMASRPPERKWSSMRKPRQPPPEVAEVGSPSKRVRRSSAGSSIRGSKVSRSEILEPSQQTRKKPGSLSLLEEEEQPPEDGADKGKTISTGEAPHSGRSHHSTAQPGHVGTFGRIQRGLKKMTSSEAWREQAGRQHQKNTRLEAREFHEGAQARKPQRFYPAADISTTTKTLAAPKARSPATRQQVSSLLSTHGATQADVPHTQTHGRAQANFSDQPFVARQGRDATQQASNDSPGSSAESFVTTHEIPDESSPRPSRATEGASSHGQGRAAKTQPFPVPRRSSSLQRDQRRRRSSEGRRSVDHTVAAVHGEPTAAAPAAASAYRYPPNSSRSRPVVLTRSQPGSHQQQKQRTPPTTPSPTFGPVEVSVFIAPTQVGGESHC